MNATKLLPDDPKITAYALGELEGAEHAAIEAVVRTDPALHAAVEEIRATVAQLEVALAEEAIEGVMTGAAATEETAGGLKAKIVPFPAAGRSDPYSLANRRKLLRYPLFYYIVGGLAAACFAVLAIITPPAAGPAPQPATEKVYVLMSPPAVAPAPATGTVGTTGTGTQPKPAGDEGTKTLANQAKVGEGALTANETDVRKFGVGSTDSAQGGAALQSNAPGPLLAQGANGNGAIPSDGAMMPATKLADATNGVEVSGTGLAGGVASSGKLYLPPFSVSADRLRQQRAAKEAAEAGAAPANEAVPTFTERVALATPQELPGEVLANPPARRYGKVATKAGALAPTPENTFLRTKENLLSTFAVDIDTTSYSEVRQLLQARQRPPREDVRIEELLNYFPYSYPPPSAKSDAPIAASLEVAEAPWAPTHRLVRVGLKAREVTTAERPSANLVFLVDVSGSMNAPSRLPLVKESLRLMLGKLRADDRVAIVTYGGEATLALASTPVARAKEIMDALNKLKPGGPVGDATGFRVAYDVAKANQVSGGINRVILCTAGGLASGSMSEGELNGLVQERAKAGVLLTVLGFGSNTVKDGVLGKLADVADGSYAAIDSRKAAEKTLVQQVNGTLYMVAKDVKIQVEFNPAVVSSYRLIGYENRALKKDEFADDKVDAGEIGAGHTVTALYEVIPARPGEKMAKKEADTESLPYNYYGGATDNASVPGRNEIYGRELLTVKVRYKKPGGLMSRRLDFPLRDAGEKFTQATPDFKFAAAVAGFGMILRESPYRGSATMANVIEWAQAGMDDDVGGYRSEFIELARQADAPDK